MSRFRGSAKAAALAALLVVTGGLLAVRGLQLRRVAEIERSAEDSAQRCAAEVRVTLSTLASSAHHVATGHALGGREGWASVVASWLVEQPAGLALLAADNGLLLATAGAAESPKSEAVPVPPAREASILAWPDRSGVDWAVALAPLDDFSQSDEATAAGLSWSGLALPQGPFLAGPACRNAAAEADWLALELPSPPVTQGRSIATGPASIRVAAELDGGQVLLAVDRPTLPIGRVLFVLILGLLAPAFVYTWESPAQRFELEAEAQKKQLERANRSWLNEAQRRKKAERELNLRESRDDLTRLATRSDLLKRLERGLELARAESDFAVGALYIGVDRFTPLNESLGPGGGDELIAELGHRLWAAARPEGEPARIGGDRFAVVLFDVGTEARAMEISERIRGEVSRPVTIRGHEIFPALSLGVYVSDDGFERADAVLLRAETALSGAKAHGGNQVALYDPSMATSAGTRLQLESDLRRAVDAGEFETHYQPIMALDSARLVGFESLVRWRHPTDGLIMPDGFIDVAEETGLIVPLTQWVLADGSRQLGEWHAREPALRDVYLSINLSARDLEEPDLPARVSEAIAREQLPPGSLRIEVTESSLIENLDKAASRLEAFRDLQVPMLLDDFGTGYSSLNYLHSLPFDFVKIDRSFVQPLSTPRADHEIVRAIVDLTHCFGMQAIAEGVESAADVTMLRSLGCEFAQGYHYSKPLPAAGVLPFLSAHGAFVPAGG